MMLFSSLLIAWLISFSRAQLGIEDWKSVPADPDVGKDMVQIVEARGYAIETHYAVTKDGYILTLFRIPHGKNEDAISRRRLKPAVLLQHGLLDSSFTWVSNFEDQSLGYILADRGFDVWFGNNRGNHYGRNHTTLDPNDHVGGFWNITWDDMATFDLPALINYVIDTTGVKSIGYVGHSEGTIQMFAAGTRLDINLDADFQRALKSVNIFVALAPVSYVSQMKAKLLVWLAGTPIPQNLFDRGVTEFAPYGRLSAIAPEICEKAEYGCDLFLMSLCGPTFHTNVSRIQVYVSQTPAGTSTLNMLHWAQGVNVPSFQFYDYGENLNQEKYGQSTPPTYNLSKMSIPTGLFYGKLDYLADYNDVMKIIAEVPSDKIVFKSYQPTYAHLDYVWAYDANIYVYPEVVALLTKYSLLK